MFIQDGKYAKRIENENVETNFKKATTFALIFGGVAGGCYYIVELVKFGLRFFCDC